MTQAITRTDVVSKISKIRRDWQDTAEGENLLDVKVSIGFLLFDLAEVFNLTQAQAKQALGEKLYTEVGEIVNSRNDFSSRARYTNTRNEPLPARLSHDDRRNQMNMKTAFVYARVSSDEQAGELTSSLGDQVNFCTQYAERFGLQVAGIYQDDFTGRVRERPGLMQLEHDLLGNRVDAIIAWNHKRIARYWPLGLSLLTNWAEQGIEIHVVNDGGKIDFANWGILLAMFGQVESDKDSNELREKLSRGRDRQVENFGRIMCVGAPTYGYRIVNKGLKHQAHYVKDEIEAEIVRLIFQWYTVGDEENNPLTLIEMSNRLESMGIKPPHPPKTNTIPEWRTSTLGRILKNELYAGVFWWGQTRMVRKNELQQKSERVKMPKEDWIRADVPELAIVDSVTFDMAAKNLERNRELAKRNAHQEYLLSGHLFCGSCGRRMTSTNLKHKPREHLAYTCITRALKYQSCNQTHKNIGVNKADKIVWDWLCWLLSDEQHLIRGIQSMEEKNESEISDKRQRVERLLNSTSDLDRRISGLIEDLSYFRDRGNAHAAIASIRKQIEDLSMAKTALDQEREKVELELSEQTVSDENIEQVLNTVREVRERLPDATFDDKRYLLRLFDVKAWYVSDGEKRQLDISCAIPAFNVSFDLQRS